jgi:putative tryptophan/tyrosine transport system substrate-binding protein
MRRREFVAGLGGAAAWPIVARAQIGGARRLGYLSEVAENDPTGKGRVAALTGALRDLGWTESQNLQIDYRRAILPQDVDRYAAELVALNPDVLFGTSTPTTKALQKQTRAIPIVFAGPADPVGTDLAVSLARPGGNVTGFMSVEAEIGGKWLELLKDVAPAITRTLVIVNPGNTGSHLFLPAIEQAALRLGVKIASTTPHDAAEIGQAIENAGREANGSLIAITGSPVTENRQLIFALANRYRLPSVYVFPYFAAEGGLMAYGPDLNDLSRRAASYVDRILRGAKPADLPVQVPTKYQLVINLKAAKAIGLPVPETFLLRADEVIE